MPRILGNATPSERRILCRTWPLLDYRTGILSISYFACHSSLASVKAERKLNVRINREGALQVFYTTSKKTCQLWRGGFQAHPLLSASDRQVAPRRGEATSPLRLSGTAHVPLETKTSILPSWSKRGLTLTPKRRQGKMNDSIWRLKGFAYDVTRTKRYPQRL